MIKNGYCQSGHRAKKLTVSQKEQIEQTDFCMLGEIQEG